MSALAAMLRASLLILACQTPTLLSDCPLLCECKWKSGKESVICLNANLSNVPLQLDTGTQILDLTSNNLVTIKQDEFSQAGLLNLQKIFVSKCRLRSLDKNSFRNLINLVELDLSYNFITAVPSHSFQAISELRELKLSGNPIQRISNEAFVAVPQLFKLEMSDCKLSAIEERAFLGLEKSLEWLKLDKNKLSDISYASLVILQSLHGLELAGNPWNCSCNLRPLREWMLRSNIPFGIPPPICVQPKRLNSKPWDKLDLDEFACVPEIFAYETKTHGVEGKNVTLTCRITGIPEPKVRWLLKNKVIGNLSSTPYSNGKKFYVMHSQNNSSYLNILSADLQDAGVYVCAAENKAGRAEASVTLAVSRKPAENTLSAKFVVVSAVAGVLLVLGASLFVVCVWTIRKKQRRSWRGVDSGGRDEDNYEKIEMNHKGGGLNGRTNQSEISFVGGVRRNGDYRVVPGADTDQEGEEEEEAESGASRKSLKETKFLDPGRVDAPDRWNGCDQIDNNDLHIPKRTLLETRDDFKSNANSTSGIFSAAAYQLPSTSKTCNVPPSFQPLFAKKQLLDNTSGGLYASAYSSELSSLAESDLEQKFPDLLENSSSPKKFNNGNGNRPCSEGGSVADISDIFCTLPRKRVALQSARYMSTDSQSPLLPESRYGSSGGESLGSGDSSRRMSDSQKHPNGNKSRVRSSSYLNLTSTRNSSVPPSPIREFESSNATPLLDVSGLESRVGFKKDILSPTPSVPSTNANSYDYHAAQLERFLEEYRHLQKQLTKMKETCDNLRQDKSKFLDPLLQNSLPVTPSSSEDSNPKSILKKGPGVPISPNSNQTLDNAVHLQGFQVDRSGFLMNKNARNNLNNSGFYK